jgi:uncharacterized protein YneF (UPF0154 family)
VIGIIVALLIGKFGGRFIKFFTKARRKMRPAYFPE